ncbi:hypothetical protein Tco_0397445 [Tanacetum coccineum]
MNPTTMMVDKGNDAKDEDEMIKPLQQTNKSHEDSSGDGGTNPAGICSLKTENVQQPPRITINEEFKEPEDLN